MNGLASPERVKLVVDLEEGRLAAGSVTRSLAGPTPTPNQVLATYLSLVYTLRRAEPGTPITLRSGDLDVLAQVLRLSSGDIEHRLGELMADPDGEISLRKRLLRGKVVVPVAGLLVAVTAVGALLLVVDRDAETSPAPVVPATAEVGTALVQTPGPDGTSVQVLIGDDIRAEDLGPGDVGLAPAQVVERGADGQPVQSDRGAAPVESTTTTTP